MTDHLSAPMERVRCERPYSPGIGTIPISPGLDASLTLSSYHRQTLIELFAWGKSIPRWDTKLSFISKRSQVSDPNEACNKVVKTDNRDVVFQKEKSLHGSGVLLTKSLVSLGFVFQLEEPEFIWLQLQTKVGKCLPLTGRGASIQGNIRRYLSTRLVLSSRGVGL